MGKEQDRERPRRAVRSFVKRTGRVTPSQQRALDELWPQFGIDPSGDVPDVTAIFGRTAPVVLEIGFGNGESLVQLAAAHPELDFLGIEVHEPGVGHCLLGIEDRELRNLRLICADAIDVLQKNVPPGSVQRINLYFPDPWPKKRHHKRRIVQPGFLELVAGCLEAEGTLQIATDWQNYAEHIDEVVGASAHFDLDERREHDGSEPLDRPPTKFEARGRRLGHRIWDWRFRKAADA